jgi:hypothetical protein
MKLIDTLQRYRRDSSSKPGVGRFCVIHWDRDSVTYLVASGSGSTVKENDFGILPYTAADTPFSVLAQHFANQGISASRMIVLLSRPELDLLALQLPPSTESELPTLVTAEVEQQLGESTEPPIIDYCVVQSAKEGDATGCQVLAFALSAKELQLLQNQSQQAGFRLAAIGSRHLAPLHLLRKQSLDTNALVIAVHLFSGETEMTICKGSEPVLLRSIRNSTDDPERVAEQIRTESQRCLTLLPQSLAELPLSWYVFETGDFARRVAKALEQQEQIAVHPIDPFEGWNCSSWRSDPVRMPANRSSIDSTASETPVDDAVLGDAQITVDRIASAANTGAARDFLGQSLPVNLLAPKRPPKPPNPWIRWGGLAALGTAAVSVGGYFLLSDIWQLQSDVQALESDLQNTSRVTAKYQEKSDQVQAVEGWLNDQVDWLSELSELSTRFPDGQAATVRRLTASTNGEIAAVDVSVQVNTQDTISELESRIRGAKYAAVSKQISQNPESEEYPWQFESHITFGIEPPLPKRFGPIPSLLESPSDRPVVSPVRMDKDSQTQPDADAVRASTKALVDELPATPDEVNE